MSKPKHPHKSATKQIDEKLCDWSKRDIHDHFEQLQSIVLHPRFVCTKCGRAAVAKKWLCKARALD
ncbi:MAG: hypothetical protein AAGF31_10565 [Planctomycetota bacterium]